MRGAYVGWPQFGNTVAEALGKGFRYTVPRGMKPFEGRQVAFQVEKQIRWSGSAIAQEIESEQRPDFILLDCTDPGNAKDLLEQFATGYKHLFLEGIPFIGVTQFSGDKALLKFQKASLDINSLRPELGGHSFPAVSGMFDLNASLAASNPSEEISFWIMLAMTKCLSRMDTFVDPITGLHSERSFLISAKEALENARRLKQKVAVIVSDLRRFKAVNDSFGHDKGDMALQITGGIFRNRFRGSDVVARPHGDEFWFLCSGVHTPAEVEVIVGELKSQIHWDEDFSAKIHPSLSGRMGACFGGLMMDCSSADEIAMLRGQAAKWCAQNGKEMGDDCFIYYLLQVADRLSYIARNDSPYFIMVKTPADIPWIDERFEQLPKSVQR